MGLLLLLLLLLLLGLELPELHPRFVLQQLLEPPLFRARGALRLGMGLPLLGGRAGDVLRVQHAKALGVHVPDEGEFAGDHLVALAEPFVDVLDQVAAGREVGPAEGTDAWVFVLALAEDG